MLLPKVVLEVNMLLLKALKLSLVAMRHDLHVILNDTAVQ